MKKLGEHALLKLFFWLAALEGIVIFSYMISLPRDADHAWMLGFSKSRFVVLLGLAGVTVIFLILAVGLSARKTWALKMRSGWSSRFQRPVFLWTLIVSATIFWVFGSLILLQWFFVSTDAQLQAYLQCLTPIVAFGTLLMLQTLFFVRIQWIRSVRQRCTFALILLGGIVLLQWLLVAEFYLADWAFPGYFVVERYGTILQAWMPYILFQTALYAQLPLILRKPLKIKPDYRGVWLVLFIVLAYFYAQAALTHAQEVNIDLARSDQDVYTEFTRQVSQSGFTYAGVRNQTPGYPYFQALFCGSEQTIVALFQCGKQANIILSLGLLVGVFLIARRFLPLDWAFSFLLVAMFSLFVFKAGYFTVELSYYFMSFLAFVLMTRMLVKPTLWLGVSTGFALGLTHLLKASVLPGFALFVAIFLLQEVLQLYKIRQTPSQPSSSPTWSNIASVLLAALFFIITIFPYIRESKAIYGQYLYNVNSTYYIWYDSWEEALQAEKSYNFELGSPNLPPDQLPGLRNYLQNHTFAQIVERIRSGLHQQFGNLSNPYSQFNYSFLFLSFLGFMLILNRKRAVQLIRENYFLVLFAGLFFAGYIFLFAWYYPIAGGPRFLYGLFLPFLFSIYLALKYLTAQAHFLIKGKSISQAYFLEIANACLIALLVLDAYIVIIEKLPNGYFGS